MRVWLVLVRIVVWLDYFHVEWFECPAPEYFFVDLLLLLRSVVVVDFDMLQLLSLKLLRAVQEELADHSSIQPKLPVMYLSEKLLLRRSEMNNSWIFLAE